MSPTNLDFLRQLCRDSESFQQLRQFLDERDILYQEFSAQMAQQIQKTQELEAQKQASESASKAKSQFLAMMSHELRTPLNSILGLSALLSQQVIGELNEKQLEYLRYIHESGEHLLALISDILDLSKVEAGQEKLRLTEVTIPELCHSCLAMVQPRATAKALATSYQVAADAEICLADERRLRQMLLNLLSNAIKFTDTGYVSLIVERQGMMIRFAVEDTGIGIPIEKRGQLFQPFTQLDRDLNRRYEGTGLGLALTQQLAQLHGGYLTLESKENCGSRFLLYLPVEAGQVYCSDAEALQSHPSDRLASPPMAELTCPSAPTVGSCRQEIVLVDEDLDHHQPLLTYVQTCGWPISPFQSWAEASQHLQRCPPRLLIVGDGVACQPTLDQRLQFLRQHPATQPIKVVVIRDPDRPASYPPGVDAWLDLPLTIPKLERILTL